MKLLQKPPPFTLILGLLPSMPIWVVEFGSDFPAWYSDLKVEVLKALVTFRLLSGIQIGTPMLSLLLESYSLVSDSVIPFLRLRSRMPRFYSYS